MDSEVDFSCEETIVGLDMQAVDVDVELLGEDARNLIKHADAVKTNKTQCGGEGDVSVCVPFGGESGCRHLLSIVSLHHIGVCG